MIDLNLKTSNKDQILDITSNIESHLPKSAEGIVNIFVTHTTCCITTADLDPGTDQDLLEALRKLLPKINYRHPHNPSHTPDHILSSIIGTSLTIPFKNQKLILGTWQRVVLVELDGPRERTVVLTWH